jgi:phosphoribosylaminoimidazole-succinocarboxamide synthase
MTVDRTLITPEVLANTLRQEVFPEVRVQSAPKRGKVRTVYDVGEDKLVLVSSDNLSTHDVVHARQVYGKGDTLDAISAYYFNQTQGIIPNHFIKTLGPNTWLTQKAKPILVEMVFRKYLTGSGWKAYVAGDGPNKGIEFCGAQLRPGYRENEMLDQVLFTPTAKGQVKDFDIPEFKGMDPEDDDPKITLDIIRNNYKAFGLRRPEDIALLQDAAFKLYDFIHEDLSVKDELLADTKWEFGYLPDGRIGLIDECVTPDSSRFWKKSGYVFIPAKNKFNAVQGDKQPFRDHVEALGLHKNKPALAQYQMPDEVLIDGVVRYGNIRETITGTKMEITIKPRREAVLEALASEGLLS